MSKENPTRFDKYRLKDVDAYRERKREWAKTPEQRQKRTEYMRMWREKNREKHNKQANESHHRNKEKHRHKWRWSRIKSVYGLTKEDYDAMFNKQNGECLICKCKEEKSAKQKFHIDHDHSTGIVRGLLCSRCNGALGWYEKHEDHIKNYLKPASNLYG